MLNCPLAQYQMNAPTTYLAPLEQRYSAKLTLTQRVKAAGHHQFKAGADFESNLLNDDFRRSGGRIDYFYANYGVWEQRRFVRVDPNGPYVCNQGGSAFEGDPTLFCDNIDSRNAEGNTINYGAFVQDSWSILPNLTINAGLRWEAQFLKYAKQLRGTANPFTMEIYGDNALKFADLLAPRLGIIYDWTKEGRSKVYGSWGRFFEAIPMDMNNRSFGVEAESFTDWYFDEQCGGPPPDTGNPDTTLAIPSLGVNCPDGAPRDTSVLKSDYVEALGGSATIVIPGTSAQYMDELTVGVEYEVLEDLRLGLSYQNRRIGRVIEDMSNDGGHGYIIGNPGVDTSEDQDNIIAEIEALGMTEADLARRDILVDRLLKYREAEKFDKPIRDYNAFQLTAAKRFSRAFMVQGSLTYSILRGNYPGLFSPDTGQLDPNITSQYDLVELMANRYGELPFDRPIQFKLDGYYTFDLQAAGRVTAGARIRGASGTPMTAYGAHQSYGADETLILPRGTLERTDFSTSADLHVAYGRKLGPMDLEVFFEIFNLLNNQHETARDRRYTGSVIDPIVGGGEEDLVYGKLATCPAGINSSSASRCGRTAATAAAGADRHARTVTVNRNFLNTTARAAPITARFGLTLSF